MHFLTLEIENISLIGPKGPDDKEMKPDANIEKVILLLGRWSKIVV
jgi:hypothetical protein